MLSNILKLLLRKRQDTVAAFEAFAEAMMLYMAGSISQNSLVRELR